MALLIFGTDSNIVLVVLIGKIVKIVRTLILMVPSLATCSTDLGYCYY